MTDHNLLIVHKDIAAAKAVLKYVPCTKMNMAVAAFVSSGDAALTLMRQQKCHIVLADADAVCTPSRVPFLTHAAAQYPDCLFLAISSPEAQEVLLTALRRENVYDYVASELDAQELEHALRRAKEFDEKILLAQTANQLLDLNAFDVPPALIKNIRANIRSILKDAGDANLNSLAQGVSILFHETLSPQCKDDINCAKAAAIELIFQLKYMLLAQNLECDAALSPGELFQKIQRMDSNEDLEDLCLYYLRRGVQIVDPSGSNNQISSLIRTALQITRQRYSDSGFTLVSLSEEIGISPNYLSSVFKMETGLRFKKYLNSYRIEQAKELLTDSHYKIYEVANLVGIEDSRYFSQIFRTYTGLKPSEYRNVCFYGDPAASGPSR